MRNGKITCTALLILCFIFHLTVAMRIQAGVPGNFNFRDSKMEKIINQLHPALRKKAEKTALSFGREFFPVRKNQPSRPQAEKYVRNFFPDFTQGQKEVLTAVVSYIALKYLDEDLKEIRNAQRKLEKTQNKLQRQLKILMTKFPVLRQNLNRSTPPPSKTFASQNSFQIQTGKLKIEYSVPGNQSNENDLVGYFASLCEGANTIQGGKEVLDELKGKLDEMNELSEATSLRLQMTMDRRSKFIAKLSQIMKSISTTQDTLTQDNK